MFDQATLLKHKEYLDELDNVLREDAKNKAQAAENKNNISASTSTNSSKPAQENKKKETLDSSTDSVKSESKKNSKISKPIAKWKLFLGPALLFGSAFGLYYLFKNRFRFQ